MVVANFGMGIRPSSSIVTTAEERRAAYAAQQEAIQRQSQALSGRMEANAADLARQNVANTQSLGYTLSPQAIENLTKKITGAYLGNQNLSDIGGTPFQGASFSAISQLNSQRRDNNAFNTLGDALVKNKALFDTNEVATASSQASQQGSYNAFNTMQTGGVLGNVARAGTGDPTQPGATMPWNQPWSTPGFGNPGSLGGLGGYNPGGGQNNQGWGSVFGGGRNPWSLA